MNGTGVAPNGEAALTDQEIDVLDRLLSVHDRGAFYMAYNAMFDSSEALLQTQISTFSGAVGGTALGPNRLVQVMFRASCIQSGLGSHP
ncbi:hypothetical protein RFM68_20770 [Mesorhizobium sp. MSK_1335]|uniref:Uncharacterized protein n=1 Tax=Mesorhizobium montanum TaxID=3072323 RepID=A0ABU4ZNH9_9HYPH|nr:hypothetical protein [Mesorhizobium sp. MSK_1335]MDX8526939.1 hypothetical protein [Mesorhizobium sp. MSK_1335]